jgi:Ion channel
MSWAVLAAALLLMLIVFVDVFEVMILPRRVKHGYRLARMFYQSAWVLWRAFASSFPVGPWRYGVLSVFGPLSLFVLMAVWGIGLIVAFALLHCSLGTELSMPLGSDKSVTTYLYFSGTTFFTLGYGDIVPTEAWGRALSVVEAGIGFGFLAVVIGYLPVLYQAFSRREITISLMDARAGSPPTAGELLRRVADAQKLASAGSFLVEWERWAAELLESHLSFPVLRYYRSQHDNQSWVGALTTILDTSALLIAGVDGPDGYQARLTFAMARHAAVDLGLVARTPPLPLESDRLPAAQFAQLWNSLGAAGLQLRDAQEAAKALAELRGLYEPLVNALAVSLEFALPPFLPNSRPVDNWQTSPWMTRSPGLNSLPGAHIDDHP